MKLSTKIILPIILISALLILLAGCFGIPADESPGYTPGTITGTIAAPCCSTSAEPVSETSGSPEYWCYYCKNIWYLQDGVEVVLTYGEDEEATTKTNEDGEYVFNDVPPGKNYVITAYCPDSDFDDNRPLVKDVALEVASTFDAKITDLVSTSLGLVVDFLVVYTEWGPEDISLDEVLADRPGFPNFPKFKKLVYEVRRVLEICQNVNTDDDVQDALCLAAEEISGLEIGCDPGFTPTPGPTPTPNPCDGNILPVITDVTLNGDSIFDPIPEEILLIVGTSYEFCVYATDPDNKLPQPLTYSLTGTKDGIPFEIPMGTDNCYSGTPPPEDVGTGEIYVNVSDGCDPTPWGPVTVVVCAPLDPALAITISDETPCYGTCATISKITVSYTDGVTPNLEIEPTYVGKNLTWVVDPGIIFDPSDGTVCLDENNDGQAGVNYNIEFTYTDECSGTAIATGKATVNFKANPTADAGGPYTRESCSNTVVTILLDGTGSSLGDGTSLSYEWFVDNVSIGTTATLSHDFDPGYYDLKLVVTDDNGCEDSDETYVDVIAHTAPTADAGGPYTRESCSNTVVTILLDGTGSSLGDGTSLSYEWFVDNVSIGTTATLSHDFDPGYYDLKLVVTDDNGCEDSDETYVDVIAHTAPTADAGGPYTRESCSNTVVTILLDGTGSSLGDGTSLSYEWFVDNVSIGTTATLSHDFDPGYYDLKLVVTDDNGCEDSDETYVDVSSVPFLDFKLKIGVSANTFDVDWTNVFGNFGNGEFDPDVDYYEVSTGGNNTPKFGFRINDCLENVNSIEYNWFRGPDACGNEWLTGEPGPVADATLDPPSWISPTFPDTGIGIIYPGENYANSLCNLGGNILKIHVIMNVGADKYYTIVINRGI